MRRRLKVAFAMTLSLGLVWLLFRSTDWREVGASLSRIRWGWFALAQLPIWAVFFLRVWRWRYIVGPVGFRPLYSATAIGFLGNTLLPARLGELIRPLVLGRLTGLPFTRALAMNALDRTTDLVGLLALLLTAVFAMPDLGTVSIPAATFGTSEPIRFQASLLERGALAVAAMLAAVLVATLVLYRARGRATALARRVPPARLGAWLADRLTEAIAGMEVLGSWPDLLRAVALSLALWGTFVVGWAIALEAFGLDWPWYAPLVIHALTQISIGVPGAPGFVGQFHVPVVLALVMLSPGCSPDNARAVAILAHLCNVVPLLLFGYHALLLEGLRLGELTELDPTATSSCLPSP